ncbi:nitroreductase family deazaflavin-dependent oxidoreductase [Streptomyces sp. BG9H]|uniref:Nitroreductase family deazaflavin-dependent oxidoreductase n=1 Tax=Streptomyces anatolicus TaxID=2675858 RepID=A0ABS6YI09_9ACTN|nr:nitroreductase/quinone reductase family protein [Streptomyces anatolicus]MBW5420750.1 nitroreductase family deazaflavin-dependent oxidoreductase [Streptomyces anatolicus]
MTADDGTNNTNPFNHRVIEEFRANGGRVGGDFEGVRLLLLTTRGAKSGLLRTTPAVYLSDPARDRLVVFASNGGSPHAPGWYHNLTKDPRVVVEVGTERYEAHAAPVDEGEHDELWRRQIEQDPNFAEFRERAPRTIPVIALTRAGVTPSADVTPSAAGRPHATSASCRN